MSGSRQAGTEKPVGTSVAGDSFDVCMHELVTFLRALKRLHTVPPVTGAPSLERAAFVLLMTVAEEGPLRPSALADLVQADLSTVSRQLAALEASGWIERARDPEDRRAFLARTTKEGRRVLERNVAARRALLRDLLGDWTESERRSFAELLARLNRGLCDCPVPGQPSVMPEGRT